MKLKLLATNGTPYFVIKYEDGEWDILKKKYEDLGLEVSRTEHGCGGDYIYNYYKDAKNLFSGTLQRSVNVRNDINSAFYANGQFNIAMLRIIPMARTGEVKVPLGAYPSIADIKHISQSISQVLLMTLETLCAMEVSIVIKKPEEEVV